MRSLRDRPFNVLMKVGHRSLFDLRNLVHSLFAARPVRFANKAPFGLQLGRSGPEPELFATALAEGCPGGAGSGQRARVGGAEPFGIPQLVLGSIAAPPLPG